MTDVTDIISDGTDGLGEASAGRRTSFGRTTSDPAEAETVSGSNSSPSASSEVGGESSSDLHGAAAEGVSSSAGPAGETPSTARGPEGDAGGESLRDDASNVEEEIDELA